MLKDTGERVIPNNMDPMNGLLLEHLARYQFAIHYVKGRVLDIACGTGYGSKMLVKAKKTVISEFLGVDLCQEAVNYAKANYYHPLLTYVQGDVLDPHIVKKHGTFDTIISFETIEHVEDDLFFMDQLYSLLKPGGTLILSTPFGQGRGKPTSQPFHYHQLTINEFKSLFTSFKGVDFYFQRGVLLEPPRENEYYPVGVAVAKKHH
ncbi:2-polyprenyl-3-methyl-5-hydroxy-6-metoxy-1,4-benzoquinol methylase [Evansella vedderi]|uniref:2-polyprenyl-3-methyl-5-hydroxy-6-metoxy-1, 4-benzoquinol methylase n=1 Tax=Evansella vedderi TaxID=38282 RepID=A0ABT9ZTN1_9BACI|nr:class I SAM-dependent methyltransferase [Evansella vedderi]MDQ0254300.1 2-polyprenyl-3-methyl-5-hydroxy-6-metoxy-1,4-benzoquinol methylase [Evansella vedderi]